MRKPVPDQDIHIVGEAYSYQQGWVEGALDTAESTLQEFFDLTWPDWLKDRNYQLMPNPCPGCPTIEGCIPSTATGATLASMTPDCNKPIEVS
jgi:hypothetical protein